MDRRARWAALLVGMLVLVAGLLLVTTEEAKAQGTPRCVSKAEFKRTSDVIKFYGKGAVNKPPTRKELEKRWKVRHDGVIDRQYTDKHDLMVDYPFCGYEFPKSFVTVIYNRRDGNRAAIMAKLVDRESLR